MKFSILVPVYNVEKYLEQCVESLLNQTYNGEYEIILVDDGSTDSSGRICDKYTESHPQNIKVIHKKNEGLVSARQAGIDSAKGEFCLFVDSDDFVELNLLEEINKTINKYPQTEIVLYSFNYFNNGKKTPKKQTLADSETVYVSETKSIIYKSLVDSTLVTSLWTKAVKLSVLQNDPTNYKLYYDKNMAEDWFRSIHLLTAAEKIVYINKHLYNYRANEQSISRSYRPETIASKNTLYVYDRFKEYLPKWGMDTEEYRQKLNARWLNEVMFTFSQYYENVSSQKERKQILNYNWCSMLPEECLKNASPFDSQTNRKLLEMLIQKNLFKIKAVFIKRKANSLYKKVKARIKAI